MADDGSFAVVWEAGPGGGDAITAGLVQAVDVMARRYDNAGTAQGSEFVVNSYTTGNQFDPSIAVGSAGDFVVVWTDDYEGYPSYYSRGVKGQRYDSAGNPEGTEFQVNTYTTGNQYEPSVALEADGDFVVTWTDNYGESDGQDGDYSGIFAQRFGSGGAPIGGEFLVNTTTTDYQCRSEVAASGTSDFVVVWQGYGPPSGYDVYGQLFGTGP
jgi:hypothetical protein